MAHLPPTRTVAALALVVAVALPVGAHIDGPDPQPVQGHRVKTSDGGNPYPEEHLDVYVKPGNLTPRVETYLEDLDRALRYWEAADDPRVDWLESLDRTVRRSEAEIVVEFHDVGQLILETPTMSSPSLGLGTPGNGTTPGQVDLTTRVGCTEISRSHDQMLILAKHEVGHALGLRHTEDPDDPMSHGGFLAGVPNPVELALDSPNGVTGRVAGVVAPFIAVPSCGLAS